MTDRADTVFFMSRPQRWILEPTSIVRRRFESTMKGTDESNSGIRTLNTMKATPAFGLSIPSHSRRSYEAAYRCIHVGKSDFAEVTY